MAKCILKLSVIIFLSFTDLILVNTSENIEEVKLNIPTKVKVANEKVIKGNFKGEKWKSWSDKITIEAKITSPNFSGSQLNLAVFYNQYSEAWILTNHSITTLCANELSSLILVASQIAPDLSPIEIEISIYPRSILLDVDDREIKEHDVSISAPLSFIVNHNDDHEKFSQNQILLLTVDDIDASTEESGLVCMVVGVYGGHCPLKNNEETIFTSEMWTTALSRATFTIDIERLQFKGPFFVTIIIAKHNGLCHGLENQRNDDETMTRPKRSPTTFPGKQIVQDTVSTEISSTDNTTSPIRVKTVRVQITTVRSAVSYIWPIALQILGMLFFIFVAFIIMIFRQFGGYEDICPTNSIEMENKENAESPEIKEKDIGNKSEDNLPDEGINTISGKAVQDDENKDVEGNNDSIYEDCADHDVVDGIVDDLINKIQSIMSTPDMIRRDKKRSLQRKERIRKGLSRLKEHPTLADMTKIVDNNVWFRRNRSRVYFYIVPLLSLYYFVPAIQFAFLAKQNEVSTGSQDLCYHNFRCSKPFYIFSDFNHVISNLSYVLFGLAFMGLVKIKEKKLPEHCFDHSVKTGILQQLSIFYAMGFSLMAQGFFSVCYHVCPTNLSLQFDTTMMYILCTLCFVKIYQFRHPDATANAYTIFMLLGALVLLEALTLYSSSWWIFIIFLAFYISMTIFIAFDIYYNGVGRIDRSITWLLAKDILFNWKQVYRGAYRGNESSQSRSKRNFLSRIRFPQRFKFSLCFTIVNICYAGYCIYEKVKKPEKSVSHVVLFILGGNMVLYLAYYIWNSRIKACKTVIKVSTNEDGTTVTRTERHDGGCTGPCCKQFIHAGSFFAISAFFLFAIGLIFYVNRSANRNLSPAESKNLNVDCTFLDFYDNHDLWHFFGAAGIFMAFCSLLTADDDLLNVHRDQIPVF